MDFVVKGIFDSMTLSDLIGTAKGNPVTEVSTILPLAAIAALIVLQILNGYGGKADKTPRSLPPGDMSPAQAGYILTGICGETDITGLLFTLLAHGCLRVDRTGKKQLRFTACREPGPELGRHAAMYYEALFGRRQPGETVSLAEAQKDIGKAYDKIYFDLTGDYKNQHKLYTDRSAAFSKISYLICFGTCLAFMLRRFLTMSSEPGVKDVAMSILISLLFAAIPMFFLWIGSQATARLKAKLDNSPSVFLIIMLFYAGSAIVYFFFALIEDSLLTGIVWLLFFAVIPVLLGLGRRHTAYGTKVYGEVCGLKAFINSPDMTQLERRQEEDQQYFYKMFAYAFVFGLENTWCSHFRDIAVPAPHFYTSSIEGKYDFDFRQSAQISEVINKAIDLWRQRRLDPDRKQKLHQRLQRQIVRRRIPWQLRCLRKQKKRQRIPPGRCLCSARRATAMISQIPRWTV